MKHDHTFRIFPGLEVEVSHLKTATTASDLNNRETKSELAAYNNNNLQPFCAVPICLGVKLAESIAFRHHLETLRKKAEFARRTVEATCWAKMGCRRKNAANSSSLLNVLHI